jgi:hypothetical protein
VSRANESVAATKWSRVRMTWSGGSPRTARLVGLRQIAVASAARAQVLAWCPFGETAEDLAYSASPIVSYERLQQARARLDCVCMLLFRKWLEADFSDHASIHVFTDGSPQWKGLEFCARSFDIVLRNGAVGFEATRRLLPCLQISKSFLTVAGKAFALLWQIYLCAGPSYKNLRRCLCRVRSVTSDFGVERMIASAPDILPQLRRWIGVPLPPDAREGTHLFPRAVSAPGWRHLIDNLIRMG